jgi:hypothetical protein
MIPQFTRAVLTTKVTPRPDPVRPHRQLAAVGADRAVWFGALLMSLRQRRR